MSIVGRSDLEGAATQLPSAIEEYLNVQAGAKLKTLRNRHKITQATIGAAVGVTQQQIRKYGIGDTRMSLGTAFLVSQAAGGNVYDLLPDDIEADISLQRDLTRDLVEISEKLNLADRKLLLSVAQRLPLPKK